MVVFLPSFLLPLPFFPSSSKYFFLLFYINTFGSPALKVMLTPGLLHKKKKKIHSPRDTMEIVFLNTDSACLI